MFFYYYSMVVIIFDHFEPDENDYVKLLVTLTKVTFGLTDCNNAKRSSSTYYVHNPFDNDHTVNIKEGGVSRGVAQVFALISGRGCILEKIQCGTVIISDHIVFPSVVLFF
jgi:hypothetical protein